jgi:hypothetical protein
MRHSNVHPVFQGLLNALCPAPVCDDCEAQIDIAKDRHYVQEDSWGAPTGEVLCENCRERRWDRQQERLMEESR